MYFGSNSPSVGIVPGLRQIPLAGVNAFLLSTDEDGLILIDTGVAGSVQRIERAVHETGMELTDIRHILLTHGHPDHAGSLAELKALTGARTYMHSADASMVAEGRAMRRMVAAPRLINKILYRVIVAPKPTTVEAVTVDELLSDGDEIPVAGGISVVHTPGHSEGHVVFRARAFDALFLGDAATTLVGLREFCAYEHLRQGMMSLSRIGRLDFEVACFGHGPPIRRGADRRFRRRWPQGRSASGGMR
jgi:glyoxylase-like metal-dependent hydrolase (beta-lactamase superfamily II)